jgi:hypothetical protein
MTACRTILSAPSPVRPRCLLINAPVRVPIDCVKFVQVSRRMSRVSVSSCSVQGATIGIKRLNTSYASYVPPHEGHESHVYRPSQVRPAALAENSYMTWWAASNNKAATVVVPRVQNAGS